MLITDKFVYVHQSKTGGTFVTDVLLRIHGVKWEARKIGNDTELAWTTPHGQLIILGPKHNSCSDIPDEHRGKSVLGTVRNPYDRYVSSYEFGWWKKAEYLEDYRRKSACLDERYPGFPDISFADYLSFANRKEIVAGNDIGAQTRSLIHHYFRNPKRVVAVTDEDYFSSGRYLAEMFDVRFLRTNTLNKDLHDFLLAVGYPADDVAFILKTEKVLPAVPPEGKERVDHRSWATYYSPDSAELVRHWERHFLALFPEFDGLPEGERQRVGATTP
ncbi:MAG: hypothetical protein ABIR58_00510 [Gemmatimonadaceae bacterium]